MAITEAQREQRKKYLGSSDAPILAGCGYGGRTIADLYLDKTNRLVDDPGNEATDRGVALEPVALDLFEKKQGARLLRNALLTREAYFCANLDAAIVPFGVQFPVANESLAENHLIAHDIKPRIIEAVEDWRGQVRRFFDLTAEEQAAWKKLRIDAGFKWARDVPGRWARRMAIEDAAALPFECERIEE